MLEICVGSRESLLAAREGGAERVELCADLAADGLTPDPSLIRMAAAMEGLRVHVLIRSRAGDFVYDEEEVALMEEQIRMARECGADGVVVGALTPAGDVDMAACRRWMRAAEGMSVTFHRAFDRCARPAEALEDIISLGCDRLLTSGQQPSAYEGIPLLKRLVEQAAGRIIIMPGAGVNPDNAGAVLRLTGASDLHASARTVRQYGRLETDPLTVRAIRMAMNDASPL